MSIFSIGNQFVLKRDGFSEHDLCWRPYTRALALNFVLVLYMSGFAAMQDEGGMEPRGRQRSLHTPINPSIVLFLQEETVAMEKKSSLSSYDHGAKDS